VMVLIRNRCPSAETTYCWKLPACTAPPTRVLNSGVGIPAWRRDGKELFYIALDGTETGRYGRP
jgi:hypothetical protein